MKHALLMSSSPERSAMQMGERTRVGDVGATSMHGRLMPWKQRAHDRHYHIVSKVEQSRPDVAVLDKLTENMYVPVSAIVPPHSKHCSVV